MRGRRSARIRCFPLGNAVARAALLCALAGAVGAEAAIVEPSEEALEEEAGGASLPAEALELREQLEPGTTDRLLGDWLGLRRGLSRHGLELSPQYIAEGMGNVSGGLETGSVYNGLLILELEMDLGKLARWSGASLHAASLFPHGRSPSETLTGDAFAVSNLDAPHTMRLFELWLEQQFGGGRFSVRVGQLAADEEFAFTEQGSLFVNSSFGWSPMVGLNAPAPIYPQGAPGARIAWHPDPTWYLQAAVYDGDPNPLDAQGDQTNPNGVDIRFDEGAFVIAEAGAAWEMARDAGGALAGSLKLGGSVHTDTFSHLRWDDSGLSLADPASSGVARELRGNWGLYLAAEQALTREAADDADSAQGLGAFARLGFAPADRNTLPVYAEAGLTYVGLIPGRDADSMGLAAAGGAWSRELRRLASEANAVSGANDPLPDFEMALEASYRAELWPGWAPQIGLQYLIHPGGSPATDNAVVWYLRSSFAF